MQSHAISRHTKVTPRKARQVADLVRRKNVAEALSILMFCKKRAANAVAKVVKSAVSNAAQKGRVDVDKLYIHTIEVDPGPMLKYAKRFIPRAMGRASAIHHRTSHIRVVLADGKT
jgi:large subunit ribosomal protein L22